jgi:hypothetical protein
MQIHPTPSFYSTLITLAILAIVLFFRFRNMGKARPLKLERLWIVPAIYLALTGFLFATMTPHGLGWLWAGLSLAAGAATGWQRGRMMKIEVDPETHAINQTASPAAMLFILAIIAIRFGLREMAGAGGVQITILVTDCLVAFALGLLTATRLEMYLRGSRLLRAARGG